MRKRWFTSLTRVLGVLASGVRADDGSWASPPRTVAPPTRPAVNLQTPRPGSGTAVDQSWSPVPARSTPPAVRLGRPVATLSRPVPVDATFTDSFVKQASFQPAQAEAPGTLYSQVPRAMPLGPASPDPSNRQFAWDAAPIQPLVSQQPQQQPQMIVPEQMPPPRSMYMPPAPPDGELLPAPAAPGGVIVSEPRPGGPAYPPGAYPGPGAVVSGDGCDPNCCGTDGCCCPDGCCNPDGCCTDCCPSDCCCCGCYPGNRFYVSGEYLLWWVKGSPLPPLLTTAAAPEPGANAPFTGALGQPNTQILYGGNSVVTGPRSGFRLRAGYWFDDERLLGIEVGGFWLQTLTSNFSISSDGSLALFRPFFDPRSVIPTPPTPALPVGGVSTGPRQNAEVVASLFAPFNPPGYQGSFSSTLRSSLWGAEANLRSNLLCNCNFFLDGLVGFRTLSLAEDLNITEAPMSLTAVPGQPAGTTFLVDDRFKTTNNFYGAQVGLVGEYRSGPWSINVMSKLALGTTQQTVGISGSTTIVTPGVGSQTFNGGFLAGSTNIGNYSRNVFSVVPELGINLGYQVSEHVRLFAGYNILYWSNVVRPGNQINLTVNPNFFPGAPANVANTGPAQPSFAFRSSDFWAQGLTVGVEFRY